MLIHYLAFTILVVLAVGGVIGIVAKHVINDDSSQKEDSQNKNL